MLDKQRAEFEEQNETLERQRFENTFFQMLVLHNENTKNAKIRYLDREYEGRSAFELLAEELMRSLRNFKQYNKDVPIIEYAKEYYESTYSDYESVLSLYYRSLYRIMQMIDISTFDNRHFYMDLVKAQLSNYEMSLIFFEGLTSRGAKTKFFIEEYALLNSLLPNSIPGFPELVTKYNPGAFPNYTRN